MKKSFFTAASFTGMAGATMAVLLICNTIQHATGFFCREFALGVAVAVSFVLAFLFQAESGKIPQRVFLAFLNGFLIYFSSFGLQNSFVSEPPELVSKTVIERVMTAPGHPRMVPVPTRPGVEPVEPRMVEVPPRFEMIEREVVRPSEQRVFRSKW